ncbi:MAG: 4Fe-4S binding protein [Candidatus Odinarchaeia archaeon]
MGGITWKSSVEYLTGEWRTFKPIVDHEKCTRCMQCVIYCPDIAIAYNEKENKIEFDYEHCKGCGVCAEECPVQAISMVKEKE